MRSHLFVEETRAVRRGRGVRELVNQPRAGEITEGWSSKIGVPELPGWVISRPRLTARIGKGSRGLLTVVTGAPGAGKTVAIASWVASLADTATLITVAWVSVDDGDCDPDLFWRYLLEAFRRAGVNLPPAGSSPFRADGIDHLRIVELASVLTRREHPVVLVLDDFRPAVGSASVAAMAYLLKLARPRLRLVVISRRDRPLLLHRYRLNPDEFVTHITDGDHAIAGYLVEEVLDAQPPTARRLLLATSILDRVNAEIAAELTPGNDGTEFSVLVGQNAFIRPLGHGWYRYHQMFQDVLRLRLQHENPGQTTALHRRAAVWFSARGLLTEAVQHAAAAHDWQLAVRELVLAQIDMAEGQDRRAVETLRGTRTAQSIPSWLVLEAWLLDAQSSYAAGNPSRGRRSLDRALRLGDREQVRLPLAGCSPWLRSVLGSDQDLARQYARLLQPLRIGPGGPDQGPPLSRKLSDRELEVLQHLAQMRTSEEIATEMFVSINTVKTHLKSIYRKLAVTRRGDAVRRAHQLELLVRAPVSPVPPPRNGHSRPSSRARLMASFRDETPSLR